MKKLFKSFRWKVILTELLNILMFLLIFGFIVYIIVSSFNNSNQAIEELKKETPNNRAAMYNWSKAEEGL